MENTVALISAITSAITLIAGGSFLFFKSRKINEQAKAAQEVNTAKSGEFALAKEEVEFNRDIAGKLREEYKTLLDNNVEMRREVGELRITVGRLSRKVLGFEKAFSIEIAKKKDAERKICNLEYCDKRKPPIGSFATEDYAIINEDYEDNKRRKSNNNIPIRKEDSSDNQRNQIP